MKRGQNCVSQLDAARQACAHRVTLPVGAALSVGAAWGGVTGVRLGGAPSVTLSCYMCCDILSYCHVNVNL